MCWIALLILFPSIVMQQYRNNFLFVNSDIIVPYHSHCRPKIYSFLLHYVIISSSGNKYCQHSIFEEWWLHTWWGLILLYNDWIIFILKQSVDNNWHQSTCLYIILWQMVKKIYQACGQNTGQKGRQHRKMVTILSLFIF